MCPVDEDHRFCLQMHAVLTSRDFDPFMKRSQSFCVSVSQSEGSFQVGPSTASSYWAAPSSGWLGLLSDRICRGSSLSGTAYSYLSLAELGQNGIRRGVPQA